MCEIEWKGALESLENLTRNGEFGWEWRGKRFEMEKGEVGETDRIWTVSVVSELRWGR